MATGPALLAKYLQGAKISQNAFAREIGVDGGVVSRWVTGVRRPELDYAFIIEWATDRKVPAVAWVDNPHS